jgi:hypothetical protein
VYEEVTRLWLYRALSELLRDMACNQWTVIKRGQCRYRAVYAAEHYHTRVLARPTTWSSSGGLRNIALHTAHADLNHESP